MIGLIAFLIFAASTFMSVAIIAVVCGANGGFGGISPRWQDWLFIISWPTAWLLSGLYLFGA